ncbi:ABC transporter permease [Pseudoalteromonas sp. MMG013]|uniref:ABC transporter permease n=1 Tax=unclassified Pseudoalteromonas TaxID=194690 RepID=UPI001B35EB7B|nr:MULTISPECIES: ABC transporter permease [unclassified Pseudoalteromonas]MBQ4850419.1 ABC transporter permease [Pseudoalteromonas sp. MMG012]MBQ4863681.1 ABC transporter permease [Pseudoalteromonas sp. MMG013]
MFFHYVDLSWRSLKRTPMVSLLMVIAIAVGIGITMTSLSVYHMMSADPIPSKSTQLHHVQLQTMDDGRDWWSDDNMPYQVTYPDAINLLNADLPYRRTAMIAAGFAVHVDDSDMKPFLERARVANADLFSMFNLEFIYGSAWTRNDEDTQASVVVISQSLNDTLFQGENSVGKTINLDGMTVRIVGVIKDWPTYVKYYDLNNGAFRDPEHIFLPFSLIAPNEIITWGNSNGWKAENVRGFQDKLKSEQFWVQFWVDLPTDEDELAYGQFLMSYMAEQQKLGRFARKELDFALRDVKQMMVYREVVNEDNKILVMLSFMFLAVCLANILGLLLAKFLRRAPEVGVRRALGASKTQVFIQHLVEVGLLGVIGGVLGIFIAQAGLWGMRKSNDAYTVIADMDLTMLLSAPAIAVSVCILAGLYPAWLVCRTTPATYLKSQ